MEPSRVAIRRSMSAGPRGCRRACADPERALAGRRARGVEPRYGRSGAHAGPGGLVTQYREVEPDVLPDDDPPRERLHHRCDQLGEARGIRDIAVGQPMDPGRIRACRNPRIDARVDSRRVEHLRIAHRHGANLDDAGMNDVEAGGLQVEGDPGQRRECDVARRSVCPGHRELVRNAHVAISRKDRGRRWSRPDPPRSR